MATDKRGPFDPLLKEGARATPPDRAAVYVIGTIVGLAILLLVLVLPPVSVLSRGGGGGSASRGPASSPGNASTYTSTVRSGMPKLPPGLVAASALFDLAAPADKRGASRLTIPLRDKQTDQRDLALYTYDGGKWQRLSDAALLASGSAARGEVSALPGNVAVLRRTRTSLQVAGLITAGSTVSPEAGATLTTLHPLAFIPAVNGDLLGQPPAVPPASYTLVPGIAGPDVDVVNTIMRSADVRQRHTTAIAEAVKQGNFAGIDVDYREVSPSLKDQYIDFVSKLSDALHADHRTLTLTLPMPASKDGAVDAGAYDWAKLGPLADSIDIAGGLDQELYFQDADAGLKYVIGKVDASKLLLTISSLSIERGGDGLRTLSLGDALTLASQVSVDNSGDIAPSSQVKLTAQNLAQSAGASGMHWDDTARSVTFSYAGRGGKRTVWIANQFSAAFRLDLAQRYGLGGVVINDVSTEGGPGNVWPAVNELADSGSITLTKPNGALLRPAWDAPDGALDAKSGDTVTWTAPANAGNYQLTLIVSDGVIRAGQHIVLNVAAPR
jgi:hypothetical protein